MRRSKALLFAALLALSATPVRAADDAPASPWDVPAEGSCDPKGGLRGWPLGDAAPALPFKPGDVVAKEQLAVLENYLPPDLWSHRERFFYEGMQLEIGPCFRDYSPPAFYREATQNFAGRARLLENGGLADYTAGLPFPPESIAAADPQAGIRWAWNVEHRYQGAGFRGKFRISDLVGRIGRAEPFEGSIFKMHMAHRADRAASDYIAPGASDKQWVAGGEYYQPFAAREYAWRQYRDLSAQADRARSDDLHAYVPNLRRVRRIAANQVEGLYMPQFSVGVVQSQQLAIGGGTPEAGGAVGSVGVGGASGTLATKRSGFEGLELRPLLWKWNVLGVQDVLAPINARNPLYPAPEAAERNFGPWGLSFASDRWDVRRALVLEGAAVEQTPGGDQAARLVQYFDLQTGAPLYSMTYDDKGRLIDLGMFVGRWSEDRSDYPRWPDDPAREVRTIDPVGAAFANLSEGGSWRRESWDVVSTPPDDRTLKTQLSVNNLTKGR
jgi:hypothetical protein